MYFTCRLMQVITDHAGAALRERVWDLNDTAAPGLPVMAPYFDMAFGWGVGAVLWLAPGLGMATCVLLGPLVALSWDLPVRVLEEGMGVDKAFSVPLIMGLSVGLPLLLMRGGVRRQPQGVLTPGVAGGGAAHTVTVLCCAGTETDWLLFSIQLANQGFFAHNAVTADPAIIPPSLQVMYGRTYNAFVHQCAKRLYISITPSHEAHGVICVFTISQSTSHCVL